MYYFDILSTHCFLGNESFENLKLEYHGNNPQAVSFVNIHFSDETFRKFKSCFSKKNINYFASKIIKLKIINCKGIGSFFEFFRSVETIEIAEINSFLEMLPFLCVFQKVQELRLTFLDLQSVELPKSVVCVQSIKKLTCLFYTVDANIQNSLNDFIFQAFPCITEFETNATPNRPFPKISQNVVALSIGSWMDKGMLLNYDQLRNFSFTVYAGTIGNVTEVSELLVKKGNNLRVLDIYVCVMIENVLKEIMGILFKTFKNENNKLVELNISGVPSIEIDYESVMHSLCLKKFHIESTETSGCLSRLRLRDNVLALLNGNRLPCELVRMVKGFLY